MMSYVGVKFEVSRAQKYVVVKFHGVVVWVRMSFVCKFIGLFLNCSAPRFLMLPPANIMQVA